MPAKLDTFSSYSLDLDDHGVRLDNLLKSTFQNVPYGLMAKLVRKGLIRCNQKKVEGNIRLDAADILSFHQSLGSILGVELGSEQAPLKTLKPDLDTPSALSDHDLLRLESWIVEENDHFIVINKPVGLAVQGGTKVRVHMDRMLKSYGASRGFEPRIVHRLDKDTSGLLVMAKTLETARHLSFLFKSRDVTKIYMAIVEGSPQPAEGLIDAPLFKLAGPEGDNIVVDYEQGRKAQSTYETLISGERASLMQLSPLTGRTHQLRVHMAHIGHPILGDAKYGLPLPSNKISRRLYLHASSLSFPDLAGTIHTFNAPLPDGFEEALNRLEKLQG